MSGIDGGGGESFTGGADDFDDGGGDRDASSGSDDTRRRETDDTETTASSGGGLDGGGGESFTGGADDFDDDGGGSSGGSSSSGSTRDRDVSSDPVGGGSGPSRDSSPVSGGGSGDTASTSNSRNAPTSPDDGGGGGAGMPDRDAGPETDPQTRNSTVNRGGSSRSLDDGGGTATGRDPSPPEREQTTRPARSTNNRGGGSRSPDDRGGSGPIGSSTPEDAPRADTRPEPARDEEVIGALREDVAERQGVNESEVTVTGFEETESGRVIPVYSTDADATPARNVPDEFRNQLRSDAGSQVDIANSSDASVVVTDDGDVNVQFEESVRERQRERNAAERINQRFPDTQIDTRNTERVSGGFTLDQGTAEQIARNRRDEAGGLADDSMLQGTSGSGRGGGQAPATTAGPEQQTSLNAARQEVAERVSEQTGQDYTAEDVQVEQTEDGQVELSVERRESFDVDWSFGLGGPEDEVEQTIDDAAEGYSRRANEFANRAFATDTETENSAGAIALRALGRDNLASTYDQSVRNLGAGGLSGAAAIGNVPGIAGGVLEGGEVLAVGAQETATGSGDEVFSDATERGSALTDAAIDQVRENPARTGGALAGSLIGSAGAISAASRVGTRTGTAARYAIQPGEELAGSIGFRATRAATNERTAQRAFPNREPLIFSEEAALRAGQATTQAARRAGSSSASRVAREATALRFRAAEAFRSDGPSRGTNDNLVSQAGQRAREEAVSARFRAAEASNRVRERASDARDRVSDFTSDDRGQAQVPRSRARSETQSEPQADVGSELQTRSRLREQGSDLQDTRGPSIDQERARGPEVTPESESFGVTRSRARVEPTLGDQTRSPLARNQAAQQSSVEVANDVLGGRLRGRTRLEGELGSRTDTRLDTRLDTGGRTDTRLGTEIESGTRTDTRLESRSRSELRSELGLETNTRSRREFERSDLRGDRAGSESPFGGFSEESSVLERDLINPFTGE